MRNLHLFLLVAAIGVCGCGSKDDDASALGSTPSGNTAPATVAATNLVGKYKAEVVLPAGKENDPAAQQAKALAESMTLDLRADNTFTMVMMMPLEGTYSVSGEDLTLSVKTMGGMNVDDAKKMAASAGKATDSLDKMKSLPFKIAEGGKRLVGGDKSTGQGEMVFVRQ